MKTSGELSNMQCEKAVPRPKPYRLTDSGGLNLLVMPSRGKLWRWNYHFEGKQKTMAYGKYPDVSLAKARVLHAAARATLASGVDPMAQRKEAKEEKLAELAEKEKMEAGTITFEDLARQWFAWWKKGKNDKYAANVESRIEHDVIARIGKRKPDEITPADLVDLTKTTDSRGARDIANRNLQFIRQMYKWGKTFNVLAPNVINPAADIDPKMILSKTVPQKFAHLDIEEVPELLYKMKNYSGNVLTRIAMELLALTFVRTAEMIKAEWKEIDFENHRWNVPKEHMKMNRPQIVPLSYQSIELLQRLHWISGDSGRLFPDVNGGKGTMSYNTVLLGLYRMGYHDRMTGHGWRHIASTYLRGQGYDKYWVEAQLSHREAGVAGVYNEAEWLDQRCDMMQAWADALDKMRESYTNKQRAA